MLSVEVSVSGFKFYCILGSICVSYYASISISIVFLKLFLFNLFVSNTNISFIILLSVIYFTFISFISLTKTITSVADLGTDTKLTRNASKFSLIYPIEFNTAYVFSSICTRNSFMIYQINFQFIIANPLNKITNVKIIKIQIKYKFL